jgi:exopolysaccharide biosynthesis polyprenyl glycosylphosphotransferase
VDVVAGPRTEPSGTLGPTEPVPRPLPRTARWITVSDALALGIAAACAVAVGPAPSGAREVGLALLALAVQLVGLGRGDPHPTPFGGSPLWHEFSRAVVVVTLGTWLWFGAGRLVAPTTGRLQEAYVFWALAIALIPIGRAATRAILRRRAHDPETLVVLGMGGLARRVVRKLARTAPSDARVLGLVGDERAAQPGSEAPPFLGGPIEVADILRPGGVRRAVVVVPENGEGSWADAIRALQSVGVSVGVVSPLLTEAGSGARLGALEELPLLQLVPSQRSRVEARAKRAMDIVVASLALLALSPVMAFAAWRIRRTSPGPILFRQVRLGQGMREFTLLKFRTMREDTTPDAHREYVRSLAGDDPEAHGEIYKLPQADAVTPAGRWLRRTSFDELPQLFNVLRGEMSIVGPRPCLPHELECFETRHLERFAVPAGLTGLWQVTARARATFSEALDFDVAYVRSWSLGLDLRLLMRTPLELLRTRRTA